uniref:START domain-containing protein n=1 Tax=Oryza barthii TaxID=65489 RepID=A0A0D3GN39_9ORYZ
MDGAARTWGSRSRLRLLYVPPGLGARRLWLACTALSAFSVAPRLLSTAFGSRGKHQRKDAALADDDDAADASGDAGDCVDGRWDPLELDYLLSLWVSVSYRGWINENPLSKKNVLTERIYAYGMLEFQIIDVMLKLRTFFEGGHHVVTEKDLKHLVQLLDNKESGDTTWQHLMERTTSNMTYKAWRREPEVGPIMYCSRTIFEDATPELVRDFFWDDEFRLKWDPMLAYFKILEEFPQNGTMIIHWIKKFPFFCSDREYIFGRRIWESGKTYYCVTKGVPYPALPKKEKPRRVELYFSSWRIRAVQSPKQDGQQSACEVTLVHYEDMGIPKDVAKVGVRHGMWGAVKKFQSGFRAYQQMRDTENTLSRSAIMARVTTKTSIASSSCPLDQEPSNAAKTIDESENSRAVQPGFDWKWVVFGGAVAAVCVLNTGLVGKALLIGAASRRQAKK